MDDKNNTRGEEEFDLDDPLGIAQEPVTQEASDRVRASGDEASVRRRRRRAGLGPFGDDRTTDGLGDLQADHKGATGIDMGYGGDDNGIKKE